MVKFQEILSFIGSHLPVTSIYNFVIIALFITGGYFLFWGTFGKDILREKNIVKRMTVNLKGGFGSREYKSTYVSVRKICLLAGALWVVTLAVTDLRAALIRACIIAILWIATKPEPKVFHKTSFYSILEKKLSKKKKELLVRELSGLCIQLKNIIITERGNVSSARALQKLIRYSKVAKPYLINFMSDILKGDGVEGAKQFEDEMGFKLAGNFSYIILKMDTLPSAEFLNQLNILLEDFNMQRDTDILKRQETLKNFTFTISSGLVILLIINFAQMILANVFTAMSS